MSGSGVDLEAARRGVQRQGFTEVVEAAFRRTVADLAASADVEGLAFADAMSAITTGGQTSIMRLLARFTAYDDAEELAATATAVIVELAPVAVREEEARRAALASDTEGGVQ